MLRHVKKEPLISIPIPGHRLVGYAHGAGSRRTCVWYTRSLVHQAAV